MPRGTLAHIHIATTDGDPLQAPGEAVLVGDSGIEGDRYFGRGAIRNVSLVEEEAVTDACRSIGVDYRPGCTRRNLTVRGLPLNDLVGRRFRIGETLLEGTRLCDPCQIMETAVGPGGCAALENRGGIRARIVSGGTIRVGDAIAVDDATRANPEASSR